MSGDDRLRIRKARVTVKDLARDLSLSTSTISRAFYDDAVIAPSTVASAPVRKTVTRSRSVNGISTGEPLEHREPARGAADC